jgi:hypothetical protein
MIKLFRLTLRCSLAVLTLAVAYSANTEITGKPWIARGTVFTESGDPLPDIEVVAHTGIGTLLVSGRTTTGPDGTFELRFGPGMLLRQQDGIQAATISVHKEGWFETNLYRQGDLLAAHQPPKAEVGWGTKRAEEIFLPEQVKMLTFTMKPAASLSGVLLTKSGDPRKGRRVGITGDHLPPSSSVFSETKTDEHGKFQFRNLPTTFQLKLYAEAQNINWRDWPALLVQLPEPKRYDLQLKQSSEGLSLSSQQNLRILKPN